MFGNAWNGRERKFYTKCLLPISEAGAKSTVDILKELVTSMHLTGGGPGLWTEIGSFALRNTRTRRRALYVLAQEVMVLPSFNKTREMRGAEAEFSTRHLDAATSYLFKAFFPLVHRVLVFYEERCRGGDSSANVRDSIQLGRMHPKEVASAIAAKFAEYDVPFSFSKYRHWQRGLVKMKGAKTVLRRLTFMREGDDGECDRELEDDNALNSVAFTQAGDSIKTAFQRYAQSSAPGEIFFWRSRVG